MANDTYHVEKHPFKVSFVCGARNLGETLRRISEGAAMIREKGEAGTGNMVQAVKHMYTMNEQIRDAQSLDSMQLYNYAKELGEAMVGINCDSLDESERLEKRGH